jgi:hypothetical protein
MKFLRISHGPLDFFIFDLTVAFKNNCARVVCWLLLFPLTYGVASPVAKCHLFSEQTVASTETVLHRDKKKPLLCTILIHCQRLNIIYHSQFFITRT